MAHASHVKDKSLAGETSDTSSGTKADVVDHAPDSTGFGEKGILNNDVDERIEITEEDCYGELGFSFPTWKKWTILSIIFAVQVSMNFNTSLYSNAIKGIEEEFHISAQAARCGAMIFLITYAFGCELWAP
ncbi:MAG: hypothetical protein Q9181_006569, partial [Wetmoreana brouardii]